MLPRACLRGRVDRGPGQQEWKPPWSISQEEEDTTWFKASGGRHPRRRRIWTCARQTGATLHRIGRRTRRPPRAGLGGSLLEGHRPRQGHEGGARAPLGGVLQGTFPSGRYKARKAKPPGVHREEHPGATGVKSHAWQSPPTRCSPTSRRGWWAACLHRRTRAQPSRVSGAPLAFTCEAL